MKVVLNNNLVTKNKNIGRYTSIASLIILAAGLFASFNVQYVNYSFIALILGFILSQVGIYYGNRWGKSPRPDEILTQSLKGIGDKYTLYHYSTKTPHLLVGPAGILALVPMAQGGTIYYDEKKARIRQKGGNLYLKIFAQESLGHPEMEARSVQKDATEYLKSKLDEKELPVVDTILVFTNPKVKLDCEKSPILTLTSDKLKDFIRKRAKEQAIDANFALLLQKALPQEE